MKKLILIALFLQFTFAGAVYEKYSVTPIANGKVASATMVIIGNGNIISGNAVSGLTLKGGVKGVSVDNLTVSNVTTINNLKATSATVTGLTTLDKMTSSGATINGVAIGQTSGLVSASALQVNGIASVNQLNLLFYDAPHGGLVGTKNIKIDTSSPYETMTLTSEGTSGGWSGRINNALSNSGGSPYVASTLVNVSGVPRMGIGIGNTLPNTTLEVAGTTSSNYYIGTGGTVTPSAIEGAIWYNRTSKKLNYYNGTAWVSW
jgi:hypothetical protein